jgi:hypothetical protein
MRPRRGRGTSTCPLPRPPEPADAEELSRYPAARLFLERRSAKRPSPDSAQKEPQHHPAKLSHGCCAAAVRTSAPRSDGRP